MKPRKGYKRYMQCSLIAALLLPVVFLAGTGHAQTGANFLRIDTSARAVSMGSAFTAVADGAGSLAYNPAGLAASRAELAFSHTNWIMDSRHDFIGAALPLKASGWIMGVGVTRLTNGDMESRNDDGSVGNSFSSYDQAVTLATARTLGKARVGMSVKYIESSIAGARASAVAVDLGLNRPLNGLPVSLGFAVQNLGTPMKYISQKDPLPLSLSAGLVVAIIPGFNVAMDVKRFVYDRTNNISVGTEYGVLSGLALRTGYMMGNGLVSSRIKGFSAGTGINFWRMDIDYAFTPFGELGNAQKITLRKRF